MLNTFIKFFNFTHYLYYDVTLSVHITRIRCHFCNGTCDAVISLAPHRANGQESRKVSSGRPLKGENTRVHIANIIHNTQCAVLLAHFLVNNIQWGF